MRNVNSKMLVVTLGFVTWSLAMADIYATYEVGNDGITLMTQQCPGDASGTLKWAISKFGSRLKEGCYTINNRGNPVVKWEGGKIQELDAKMFRIDPSQAVVKREIEVRQSVSRNPDSKAVLPSFDCTKAQSNPEKLICGDDQLSKLDNELSRVYKEAKSKAADPAAFRKQTEAEWRWRENNCHTKECLLVWYVKRKGQLNSVIEASRMKDSAAVASGWKHDENIVDAARQYKAVYCAAGMRGVEDFVRGCYASITLRVGTVPQKLERCIGIDYTASRIDAAISQEAKITSISYFERSNMLARSRGAFTQTGMPNEDIGRVIEAIGTKTISAVDDLGWGCNGS